jgi:hypothetical protein
LSASKHRTAIRSEIGHNIFLSHAVLLKDLCVADRQTGNIKNKRKAKVSRSRKKRRGMAMAEGRRKEDKSNVRGIHTGIQK